MALAEKSYVDRFCIDAGTGRSRSSPPQNDRPCSWNGKSVIHHRRQLAGPIGVPPGGRQGKPDAIVSFCMDGVKKIAPPGSSAPARLLRPISMC
jgi:hypothetical protein